MGTVHSLTKNNVYKDLLVRRSFFKCKKRIGDPILFCQSIFFFRSFLFHDFCVRCIPSDGSDAVLAVGFGRIAFAYSNDLTVCSFEAETELAGFVLIELILRILEFFTCCLILNRSQSILSYALDAVLAGAEAGIALTGRDDFSVAGLQIEAERIVLALKYYEFSHGFTLSVQL